MFFDTEVPKQNKDVTGLKFKLFSPKARRNFFRIFFLISLRKKKILFVGPSSFQCFWMSGRLEDTVWRCFSKSKIGDKKYFSATCKGCAKVLAGVHAYGFKELHLAF